LTLQMHRAFAVYNAFRKPAKKKKDDCLHVYIHQREMEKYIYML